MGIFDGFMEGEQGGIPTGVLNQGGWRGALEGNNPLLNIGLGILANNQGNYGSFGAAIGKGAQQGVQNTQEARQAALQSAMYNLQMAKAKKELEDATKQTSAIKAFKLKHPELADVVDLDPKAAIKSAYPQMNSADPYMSPIYDATKGMGVFNHRDGSITWPEQKIVKPTDSPMVRGAVKGAEAQATAGYKINTDTGSVMTDRQVAESLDPALQGVPQMPQQAPQMPTSQQQPYSIFADPNSSPEEIAQLKAVAAKDYAANGNNYNAPPTLPKTRYPTLAEQAATKAGAEASAKAKVELETKPKIEAATATAKLNAEDKAKSTIDLPKMIEQSQNTLNLVDQLVGSKDGTIPSHKGLETATGLSSKIDPRNYIAGTDATNFNIRLDQLKGQQFMEAYQTLKGGGQITEVEGKKATDAISRMNTAGSKDEFVKAARDFQDVIKAGMNRAKMKVGGVMPKDEKMPNRSREDILKQYGVKK